jgi:hypothetical protein
MQRTIRLQDPSRELRPPAVAAAAKVGSLSPSIHMTAPRLAAPGKIFLIGKSVTCRT